MTEDKEFKFGEWTIIINKKEGTIRMKNGSTIHVFSIDGSHQESIKVNWGIAEPSPYFYTGTGGYTWH